jgi:Flp pilus assembly pilin Flp
VACTPVVQQEQEINRMDPVREDGQTMAEYAVVLAVITPLVVAIFTLLSSNVAGQISRVASYLKP